jgi:hypothetical protein
MPVSLDFFRLAFPGRTFLKRFAARGFCLGATMTGALISMAGVGQAAIVGFRAGPAVSVMLIAPVPRPLLWVGPPAPRIVVAPVPRRGWIWSPRYWHWTGATYLWVDGLWLPERPRYDYAAAHWMRGPGGWIFVPGAWVRRPL